MRLQVRKPTQALNKAYAKQSIAQEQIDVFRRALLRLFAQVDEDASEEQQRKRVADFLNEAFYKDGPAGNVYIDSREGGGLAIRRSPTSQAIPGVLIEVKKVFASEMMTTLKNNVKSLHKLILGYFEEREQRQNTALSYLVITDVYNWFFFDETDFCHFFYNNARLRKLYQVKYQQNKDNAFFYSETARILREMDEEVPVTCLNLREMETLARRGEPDDLRRLIPVYKLFSPEHLLRIPFTTDGNTLNRLFYDELLHIIGLREIIINGRNLIERLPEGERLDGSLLENTISTLRIDNALADLTNETGNTDAQLVSVALELCITWLNRVLFLKLLEGQLMRDQNNSRDVQFLTPRHLREFDELDELFFEVLAVPENQRPVGIVNRYGAIPHLNSSLFELTDLERRTLSIKALKARLELPLYEQTILETPHGKPQTGQLPTLQYLLAFLDAYDFSLEGPAEIQPDNKPLINATGLGLILEKLSGYRDGSFYTPGFVTTYLVRDVIRRTVVDRFNERFEWYCTNVAELRTHLDQLSLAEANAIINSLRVVDPAVGSGHFLVSALNEIITLKAELGILADWDGRRLDHYDVGVFNNELVITDESGEVFQYSVGRAKEKGKRGNKRPATAPSGPVLSSRSSPASESQWIQETIFHEKQAIIENCLFGVDSNPTSASICRLRLWIELLKSAYYTEGKKQTGDRESENSPSLQALPNVDINIKVGNSLVGRFGLGFRVESIRNASLRERFLPAFQQYRTDVMAYKKCRDKTERDAMRKRIAEFEQYLYQLAMVDSKEYAHSKRLEARLAQLALTFDPANQDARLHSLNEQLAARRAAFNEKQEVFQQAFEWRFFFPEVLDDMGNYVGFDVVVSNPPYNADIDQSMGEFLSKQYEVHSSRSEAYGVFVERGLSLLKDGGQFSYVVPDTLLDVSFMEKTRSVLLKELKIESVSVLPSTLFGGHFADTVIICGKKQTTDRDFIESDVEVHFFSQDKSFRTDLKLERRMTVPARLWYSQRVFAIQSNPKELMLLERIDADVTALRDFAAVSQGIKVYQVGKGNPPQTAQTRSTKPFTASERLSEDWFPFVDAEHVDRYQLNWLQNSYVHYGPWLAEPRLLELFEGEKILVPKATGATFRATYALETLYCDTSLFVLKLLPQKADIPYKALLGVLNSRFMSWYFRRKMQLDSEEKLSRITIRHVAQAPVPNVLNDKTVAIEQLVGQILVAKAANPSDDTTALEAEVDRLTYELYGLSAEEVALIEG